MKRRKGEEDIGKKKLEKRQQLKSATDSEIGSFTWGRTSGASLRADDYYSGGAGFEHGNYVLL